jgi:hypothetical protein
MSDMRGGRPRPSIRPIGGSYGGGYGYGSRRGGWSSFSPRRKFRLIRSGVLLLVLIILISLVVSRCGDDGEVATSTTTTTAETTTTTAPPLHLNSVVLPKQLPSGRYQAAATVVGDQVLLLGGLSKAKSSTSVVWSFDPASGSTTQAGSLTTLVHASAAGTLGGVAYNLGGGTPRGTIDTVSSYRPGDSTSTVAGALPTKRTDAVAVTDAEHPTIYVAGGWDGTNPTNDVLATTDGKLFSVVGTLAEPVRSPAAVLLGNDLWVFGGVWNDVQSASIQRLDLRTHQASVVAQMPAAVSHAMAFVLNDTVFVAGGRVGGGRSNEIRRFDPSTFTFEPAGSLQANLSDAAVAVVGGSAYLLGGLAPLATAQIEQLSPVP